MPTAAQGRAGRRCRSSTCWVHAWTSSRVCVMRYTRSWSTRTWAFGKASSRKRWARLTWPPRCRTRRPTCRPSRPSTNTFKPPPSCDTPSSPPLPPPPRTATTVLPPQCHHDPQTRNKNKQ
ncbi:uncharacterized protein ACA1_063650 [Acanthamoeba castellanii str. Neff]|uniref:Uncharacterized protein n=1 Tax=Acanthamoeba castellanii (strain ATCC 30010 / Neff) TaxID=1257118 RepID=L8GZT9_ACACF|nr:uncharacterized protein ACA1_063650 [Acanthamoeba castellanii str. Neff]ELR17601.1 hypothetical protein ACA1_063650 [Acanthamoeba castellanii str. Neff]